MIALNVRLEQTGNNIHALDSGLLYHYPDGSSGCNLTFIAISVG